MRNRSPLESDDSENSDENEGSSGSRSNSKSNSLNWHIANREWITGHVTTEPKPKNLPQDGEKSEDVKSRNLRSKLKKKSTNCSSCIKRKSALYKSKKRKFGKCNWCCCCHRQSETSVSTAPSTSTKKKRRKAKKKTNLPKEAIEPKAAKKIQETEKIEEKHEHLHEKEKRPVKKLIEHDEKPVKNQQEQEPHHEDKSVETSEEKAHPELRIESTPLVTAGTSVDMKKSCCYVCAQNAMLICGALGTLVGQKNIRESYETDTKSTQVAVKYRIRTKPEPIATHERGTVCQRSDLPSKSTNKFPFKKFKIPKNIRNMFTRDQIVMCDARPSIQPRRQTICCMKNCRFID